MNPAATSKDQILVVSRQMIMEKGISAINMRVIASQCNVAVGCIYNYFPSKTDLINATIESVWKDIFHGTKEDFKFTNFVECISWLFETIKNGGQKYPEFFSIHSLNYASEDKQKGRQMMNQTFETLKQQLLTSLQQDEHVRSNIFSQRLTPSTYVNYIFTLLLSILLEKKDNCESLLELIKNSIY